ncbi:MAG: 4-(cytidine 5'-diphospho)-2-C-methyl-D-erythritol kinase [Rubrobacteraceae bacterium]
MGSVVRLRAFAKVNYVLAVLGLRSDGYHEVATVLQSISLADELDVELANGGFELAVEPEGSEVGPPEKNTVFKAWSQLGETTGEELPVKVRLRKKIPSGAGLGGASADAAAALVGINRLFGLGLGGEELREIGGRIGADVPFCISGGTALGEGIGGILTPLPAPPAHKLLVVKPQKSAGTARIYRAYDNSPVRTAAVDPAIKALYGGDLNALAAALDNDLAATTGALVPEVSDYEKELLESGALGANMSGTGTAVYGVFAENEASLAAERLRTRFAGIYEPVSNGVEIL